MELKTSIIGHVHAAWKDTGEVVLDKKNAIHKKNMAIALARGLANENGHQIYKMVFGNGGTYVEVGSSGSGSAQFHYNPPKVNETDTDIYSPTYAEIIDDVEVTSNGNQVVSSTGTVASTSLVICTCTLSAPEPNGQAQIDNGTLPDGSSVVHGTGGVDYPTETLFAFDEIGLKTSDNNDPLNLPSGGLLLSHIIFNPIEKTANRELIITYTLTISVS